MIAIIVLIVIAIFALALGVIRTGAVSGFQWALKKCKRCKYYTGNNDKYRFIYCEGYAKIPEEVSGCDDFVEKKDQE